MWCIYTKRIKSLLFSYVRVVHLTAKHIFTRCTTHLHTPRKAQTIYRLNKIYDQVNVYTECFSVGKSLVKVYTSFKYTTDVSEIIEKKNEKLYQSWRKK